MALLASFHGERFPCQESRGVGPGTYSPRFPKSRSCSMGVGSRPEAMDAGDMPGPGQYAVQRMASDSMPNASPVKRPCWQESSPGPAASRIPPFVQASPAKRPCWQESSPVAENPPCSPGPASVSRIPPFVQASPAKRPCWQESSPVAESPACSPGIATAPKDLPSSGKRIRTQDAASPISERIAQAPSPIRALHFGPAKGEVEDVAPVFPGAPETVPEDLRQVDIIGVYRYCNLYPRALAMVASGKINLKPLISKTFQLEDVQNAFEHFASGEPIKVLIQPNPPEQMV